MGNTLVRYKNVDIYEESQIVLKDVWAKIDIGQIVGLFSLHYSETRIFAKSLCGQIIPINGNTFIYDEKVLDHKQFSKEMQIIGYYMEKEYTTYDSLSILDNFLLLRGFNKLGYIHKLEKINAIEIIKSVLPQIDPEIEMGALDYNDRLYCELALQIVSGKKLIILDDWIGYLYRNNPIKIANLFKYAINNGVTIVLNSEINCLIELADSIIIFNNGRCVMQTRKDEYDKTTIFKMASNDIGNYDEWNSFVSKKTYIKDVMLEMRDFRLGKQDDSFDIRVHEAEVVGILSMDREWLSEWKNFFLNEKKLASGSIFVNGKKYSNIILHSTRKEKAHVMLVPSSSWRTLLFESLSISENLLLSSANKISIGPLGYISRSSKKFGKIQAQRLKLSNKQTDTVRNLSDLQCMCLIMERIKFNNPDVLVLWEVTETPNIVLKTAIKEECRKCTAQGIAILFLSSSMNDAIDICDRIYVFKDRICQKEISTNECSDLSDISYFL